MIWPTMTQTPQKLKRPRKEPQPGLKLCKRKRRNLAPNFPFPRQIVLPDLVERPALFLLLVVIREFKQITMAGATTAAVTEKVWGEYVSVVCQIFKLSKAKYKDRRNIFFQFSFSQPNDFAQRTMAVIRFPRTYRLVLSESECRTLCTLDEIYNFRDKYLTEYRVKITNILILKEAKQHRIVLEV